ncbi:MAG: 4-hydroxy-tetrahydrodipicolinate synthase [Planctomycetes bacterium]|nr:4-hydroxy-tetrahydrodipicolinate synthase [Planctomycetota bacterium]
MTVEGEKFCGLTVAMITPFRDGEIDIEAVKNQVEFHVENGTDTLAPVGTTGESPTLSHEEHERLIAAIVENAAGRIQVMAGTGSNSTAEAIRLTQFAERTGADGALVVAPYYNKPTQEGFYQHYLAVAHSVELPIVVYNIPGRTGKNIEPETLARLSEVPNIVAVKESTGSMDQASQIMDLCDLVVLSGDDSLTLPLLSIGGKGVVSVVGNIIPGDMKALLDASFSNEIQTAIEWHRKLFPLCRDLLGMATNPIPIKTAMKLMGRDTGELRLPMCPMDSDKENSLAETLKRYGLL